MIINYFYVLFRNLFLLFPYPLLKLYCTSSVHEEKVEKIFVCKKYNKQTLWICQCLSFKSSNILIIYYIQNYEPISTSSTNNCFKLFNLLWKTSWSLPLEHLLFVPNFQTIFKLCRFYRKHSGISTVCSSSVSCW